MEIYTPVDREAFDKVLAGGSCDPGVIEGIVAWVVEADKDAREKFGKDVRHGALPYDALIGRLGHDANSLRIITRGELEAKQSLAKRGFS